MANDEPVAWMRKWAFDGEKPEKVKGKWPTKFKFQEVTIIQCFKDDVALVPMDQMLSNKEKT